MEGCTDGRWINQDGHAHQFFKCHYGKGLFYPLHVLQPDSRCSSQVIKNKKGMPEFIFKTYIHHAHQDACILADLLKPGI